jgi:hypothetical protein
MCYYVLVGAKAEGFQLREAVSADGQLDTDLPPDPSAVSLFPAGDTVVCVTLEGCSCSLLETPIVGKVARQHKRQRDAFYAALTRAMSRFGNIRLLVQSADGSAELSSHESGSTTLRDVLAARRPPAPRPVRSVA